MNRAAQDTPQLPEKATSRPARIALFYGVLAAVWIVLSGALLSLVVSDPVLLGRLELAKGLAFVLVTSGLLYLALSNSAAGGTQPGEVAAGLPSGRRLGALFVALALVVPVIGLVIVGVQGPRTDRAALANLEDVARLKGEAVERWIAERDADAANLGADENLGSQIGAWIRMGAGAAIPDGVARRLEKTRSTLRYDGILIRDAAGRLLHAFGEQPDTAPVQLAAAAAPVSPANGVRHDDLYRDAAGRVYMDWTTPIVLSGREGERSVATIVLRARAESFLFPMMESRFQASPSAETLLVRREGDAIVFLNPLRHQPGAALSTRRASTDEALPAAEAARQGRPGTTRSKDYRGVEVLAAYRPVVGTGWHVIAKIDRAEVRAPLHDLVFWVSLVAVAAFVAISFALLALWRQQRRAQSLAVLAERGRADRIAGRFFELPFIGMAMTSPATKHWLRFNDRLCEILGYPREELARKSWAEITHPDDIGKDQAEFERVMRGDADGYAMDKRFIRGDGSVAHATIDVKAIRDASGAVDHFLATIEDITERKRAEAQLRRQRNLYAALSDTNHAIVRLGTREEAFQSVCAAAVERAGFQFAWVGIADPDRGELRPVARHGRETGGLDAQPIRLSPGDALASRPSARAFLEGAHQVENDMGALDSPAEWLRLARAAGVRAMAAFPIRQGGKPVGTFCVHSTESGVFDGDTVALLDEMATDLSFALDNLERERHRAEAVAALEAAEARWHFALEGADHGVFEWNVTTGRVFYSRQWKAALGFAEHEVGDALGEWETRVHPDDLGQFRDDLRRHFSGEDPIYIAEFRIRAKDGSYRWMQARGKVMTRDGNGEPATMIGTQTDITDRKLEQAALLRRDAVLAALGTAAQRFLLSARPWREEVDGVLAAVGAAAEVSRVYLFENLDSGGGPLVSRQTHEWVEPGVASFLDAPGLQAFRWEDFGVRGIVEALGRGEPVFRHRRDVPAPFAAVLAEENVESLALVPVFVDRRFWGVVGFDECDGEREWEHSERESLAMIAATLGAAIHEEAARLVLVESEARFRRLVEQSLVGIFIIDAERILYANPRAAEILGNEPGKLLGKPFRDIVAGADWPRVEAEIRRVMTGETASGKVEFTSRRADGREIMIGAQGIRILHEGRPATLGVMQDISEKQRAEEQIRRYVLQLESAVKSTVAVAMALSELRDPYTAGHERRVADVAVAIGRELGLDTDRLEGLRVAGQLHDVGKMTIPTEILAKPGRLSPTEYELIKGHAQAGYEVLKAVEFPWPVAEIARQHHERVDGSGYPQGLKGEAILLEARIMAVADVVEAMSSHRPYRAGLGIERALAEIERGLGSAYDAAAAGACLRLFREKGFAIPD